MIYLLSNKYLTISQPLSFCNELNNPINMYFTINVDIYQHPNRRISRFSQIETFIYKFKVPNIIYTSRYQILELVASRDKNLSQYQCIRA